MRKVNVRDVEDLVWSSPGGRFGGSGKQLSEALGREPESTDVLRRHPFDVELSRIPAGGNPFPFHSHSAQWEFYYIVSGGGTVRHAGGMTPIEAGDAFLFRPGEPHGFTAGAEADLVMFVVADNPFGESTYYPDSMKWSVRSPERRMLRSENLDYYDGEDDVSPH